MSDQEALMLSLSGQYACLGPSNVPCGVPFQSLEKERKGNARGVIKGARQASCSVELKQSLLVT